MTTKGVAKHTPGPNCFCYDGNPCEMHLAAAQAARESVANEIPAAPPTPGPWEVRPIKGLRGIFAKNPYRSSKYLLNIADVKRAQAEKMPAGAMEANARLIAAAPELLASLRKMVYGEANGLGEINAMLATARAAIAKAEGREGK